MSKQFIALDIIDTGDAEKVRSFVRNTPWAKNIRPGYAGGGWLHYAASNSNPEIIRVLVEEGYDLNDNKSINGDKPIANAASYGRIENVQLFLDLGAELDTDLSVRNPLFSAIVAPSAGVTKLLLEHGIDAEVRYNSDTMTEMDAMSFALWRGEKEIAILIADFLANSNGEKMHHLLTDAERRVALNGELQEIRLVPTIEELETMKWDSEGNLIED